MLKERDWLIFNSLSTHLGFLCLEVTESLSYLPFCVVVSSEIFVAHNYVISGIPIKTIFKQLYDFKYSFWIIITKWLQLFLFNSSAETLQLSHLFILHTSDAKCGFSGHGNSIHKINFSTTKIKICTFISRYISIPWSHINEKPSK